MYKRSKKRTLRRTENENEKRHVYTIESVGTSHQFVTAHSFDLVGTNLVATTKTLDRPFHKIPNIIQPLTSRISRSKTNRLCYTLSHLRYQENVESTFDLYCIQSLRFLLHDEAMSRG